MSSPGWVDPVPDPILPEIFLGYSWNRTRELLDGSQTFYPLKSYSQVIFLIPLYLATSRLRLVILDRTQQLHL